MTTVDVKIFVSKSPFGSNFHSFISK